MYRQGDVLLRPVHRGRRTGLREIMGERDGSVILAHGEVTGHAHAFRQPGPMMFRDDGLGGGLYVEIPKGGSPLTHEEHDAIHVEAGLYEVILQREYHPDEDIQVID